MATHDYVIDNQTAPNFRADLNNALLAIVSNNSNATQPAVTYANMMWYDTAENILYMRNEDNDDWIRLGTLDQTADTFAAAVSLASQAEAEAGTDNTKVMTPLRVKQNFTANQQQVGVGQTWQNLIGSRARGVTYQNTAGRPIMVAMSGDGSGGSQCRLEVSADNVTFVLIGTSIDLLGQIGAVVPSGAYYRFTAGDNIFSWAELR